MNDIQEGENSHAIVMVFQQELKPPRLNISNKYFRERLRAQSPTHVEAVENQSHLKKIFTVINPPPPPPPLPGFNLFHSSISLQKQKRAFAPISPKVILHPIPAPALRPASDASRKAVSFRY